MSTVSAFKTDLYALHGYTQNTLISYPKELFIENLRKFFSQDSYYHYQRDEFGFALTPDQTNMLPTSGINDSLTTRIFIGEPWKKDIVFYPALFVKHGGAKSVPLSMSRDQDSLQWQAIQYTDGYGNSKIVQTPVAFIQSGAWEGSIVVDVASRSSKARDEISELVALSFVDFMHKDMFKSGVLIKSGSPSISSPTETDDRVDKLFRCSLTFDIRTEWSRHIPVTSVVDAINICIDLGNLNVNPPALDPNMSISTTIELVSALQDL